jgi:hypothetical protein
MSEGGKIEKGEGIVSTDGALFLLQIKEDIT